MPELPLNPSGQILEATIRSLAAKGSAHVSLRDIAREAGVALSQLHYYFRSREKLLAAAASYMIQRHMARLRAELADAPTVAERISRSIRYIGTQTRSDPTFARILLDLRSTAGWLPELATETRRLEDELLELILTQSPGQPPRAVARLVLGALDGLALQVLQGAPASEMEAAYAALESVLRDVVEHELTQER